ncbi:hypothetical protein JKF63_07077 [Porcisia hertigi]|uniref:Uncharacterized protein n=1 Tax=Porcisia hertigi TaxID=2761500 RepID=A0A836LKB0_9TRYP|nr:hypothetical protein JKF63_07077 [Porcisia hertigi]
MNATQGSSGSGAAKAAPIGGLDVLMLQTFNDQQLIILRQKELVKALKERVEELEGHQRQTDVTLSAASAKAEEKSATLSYTSEVELQRHVKTLEKENQRLSDLVGELRGELNTVSEQLHAQKHHAQKEMDAWKEKVTNTEAKCVNTAQLLEEVSRRNQKLLELLDRHRGESEVSAYESAQWRSLATTAVGYLDRVKQRYARDQIYSIEEDVQRYASRRLHTLHAATSTPQLLENEALEETRKMWSRSAQVPKEDVTLQTMEQQQQQQQEPVPPELHVSN